MDQNKDRSDESIESAVKRPIGDFREPKSMLLEPIQGSIDVGIEDNHTEAHTRTCGDTESGMTPEELEAELLPTDETEGNK